MLEKILSYIFTKYQVFPEQIFKKYPGYMVFRHRHNERWFGVLMSLKTKNLKDKSLIFARDKNITLINLKLEPGLVALMLDNRHFLPAYHMNKRHWISVVIDEETPLEEVFDLIDDSYKLTQNAKAKGIL
ncbi:MULTISPECIES: MmcQ/YjbR family DNA-binding protein [unclassified Campylobacter]|uniref:MmcQ/YjbR family DNA-binding protein n=1 Tax=unclassified Campylobacter TaxID=2593542 RepID=UPI003D337795